MKSCSKTLVAALGVVAAPVAVLAAFAVGGLAYTKRPETALLAEPNAMAAPAARIPYARSLKVEEVRGRWLRVKEGKSAGWVFAGNVAEEKPEEIKGLDGLPIAASETTATAAARPLAPTAVEYGNRRGLTAASEDIKWLTAASDAIKPADVIEFLKEQKKGEFQ